MPSRHPAANPAPEPAVLSAFASPIGPIHAAAIAGGVIGLEVLSTAESLGAGIRRRTGRPTVPNSPAAPAQVRRLLERLEDALATHMRGGPGPGGGDPFREIPVVLEGLSDWDRRVLEGVRSIGFGEVAGYGEVARRIGAPGAARAVGGAVGRNPVGLLVPCHRVVAGDGTLGGYGGSWSGDREALLSLKERLLALEGVHLPRRPDRY